jgi:type VI secretion system protein ImpH
VEASTGITTAAVAGLSEKLRRRLQDHPEAFSFLQIVRLLQRLVEGAEGPNAQLLIRPELSLSSPRSEVTQIAPIPGKAGFEILTSFLGLYGISSPLPAWYSEELIEAELDDKTDARQFLDIIHQRLYTLFYHSLLKYRLSKRLVEDQVPIYASILFRMIGIDEEQARRVFNNPGQILRYILLYRQQPRSAEGLKTLLKDALGDINVEIQQCVARKVQIPTFQRCILGQQSTRLGVDAMMGDEVEDKTGKITITLGPLSLTQFQQLLDGSQTCLMMIFLIDSYMNVPLECDLEFILSENEAQSVCLGDSNLSCLGKNTWILNRDRPEGLHARIPMTFLKETLNAAPNQEGNKPMYA